MLVNKTVRVVTMVPYYKEFVIEGEFESQGEFECRVDELMSDIWDGDLIIEDHEWVRAREFKDCNKSLNSIYEQQFTGEEI